MDQQDRLESKLDYVVQHIGDLRVAMATVQGAMTPLQQRVDDLETNHADTTSDVSELKEAQDQASGAVKAIGWLGGVSGVLAIVTLIVTWAKAH